ncbi:MAG: hypothetical protein MPK62_04085, partial [Alphaproteobacteria bacterium]|nr:hypothetical protein [Alphaproteobacteria bacterium]
MMASEETAAAPESGRFRFELATPEAAGGGRDLGHGTGRGGAGGLGVVAGRAAVSSPLLHGGVAGERVAGREQAGGRT